jgi:hypothetical protein
MCRLIDVKCVCAQIVYNLFPSPPLNMSHAILTTSASIFLTPGKASGCSGFVHRERLYTSVINSVSSSPPEIRKGGISNKILRLKFKIIMIRSCRLKNLKCDTKSLLLVFNKKYHILDSPLYTVPEHDPVLQSTSPSPRYSFAFSRTCSLDSPWLGKAKTLARCAVGPRSSFSKPD